jgi:hypothetical protein
MASAVLAIVPFALAAQSEADATSQQPPGPGEALPAPDALEAEGAVIGEIRIAIGDIFDTHIPGERAWLYRTANKLHIQTREQTIREQLLFKPGEPYRARVIDETERLLRANGYLYSAEIEPVGYHDGVVDLVVRTRDVWTLNPGFSYSRAGAITTSARRIEEKNLLGTGQEVLRYRLGRRCRSRSHPVRLCRPALQRRPHAPGSDVRGRQRRRNGSAGAAEAF